MAYVAARGGETAIQEAEQLYQALNGPLSAATVGLIERQLPYLLDRVMGEGSLYAPELAALAIAQTGGDLYEAVLLLRAYRSTQPRLAYARPFTQHDVFTVRRISAAFKDIPDGQLLGPTLDYSHRLLRLDVLDRRPETEDRRPEHENGQLPTLRLRSGQAANRQLPTEAANLQSPITKLLPIADWHRSNGLLAPLPEQGEIDAAEQPDVTREPISFPATRAHRLQSLARADTGGVLALGYASMRGYGLIHPTVNEVRLGYADVVLRHPVSGAAFSAGRVRVSQAEVVTPDHEGAAKARQATTGPQYAMPTPAALKLGFTATLGWNEVKCIAGSMLDLEMDAPNPHPAHQEEFVLYHTEPVESSGFCIHYKLPHYVTFGSNLDSLRKVSEDRRPETEDRSQQNQSNER
ncbi:MAG: carbon-phosphorus lyase complex subunit PhnI [Chloroflexaceae bacterium]|jgi:alpha-D-ribose 1-methylphosphonate 5-triphosphate synthase subunit PhnI|nr:carbon-phosphorus lyase complex subunit PhnI [Chloroflexaceae bacterium]